MRFVVHLTIAAAISALAACGGNATRSQVVETPPTPEPIADAADQADQGALVATLANDARCRCLVAAADLATPPVMRNGLLEIRLNPRTVLEISFPSSGADVLRVSAAMLVVAFDLSDGVPKVRTLRLLGSPATIRDAAGAPMVISPRIALGIGEGGIMSIDIDPAGIINRIPGA